MMSRRVVVTGYGLVTPLGCQVETVWQRMLRGESGVKRYEQFSDFRSQIVGMCNEFVPQDHFDIKDRFTLFALAAARDAVAMAGIDFSREDPFRCASIVGCGVGGLGEIEVQEDRYRNLSASKISPYTIPKIMLNAAAGNIAIAYQIHGPARGVATACASANDAMADAFRTIRCEECDVVITGGTESAVTNLGLGGFSAMRALSERNDDPEGASRPFDKDRDGFVLGEGAGILVFEDYEHAKKRGAAILGEVLGCGITTDACHITKPDSEGIFAAAAMESTLRNAHLGTGDIDYINLHGTSTILGDIAESAAIERLFSAEIKTLSTSSTKSMIGHLLGGSGGVELIVTLLALRDNVVPPTINLINQDPECHLDFTPLQPKEKPLRRAISNSFGFGGHNACILVGKGTDL